MKVVKKILYVIVVLALVLSIGTVIVGRVTGMHMFAVLTGSMAPERPVGSLIITKPVDITELKVGDDVTYVRDANLTVITHRIIEIDLENDQVVTQGIANNVADKPVQSGNIVGKVIYCVPKVGYVFSHLSTTQGKIILITVFAAIAVLLVISDLYQKGKEKNKKETANPELK